jgi:hypothetical protein
MTNLPKRVLPPKRRRDPKRKNYPKVSILSDSVILGGALA